MPSCKGGSSQGQAHSGQRPTVRSPARQLRDNIAKMVPELLGFFRRRLFHEAEDLAAETVLAALHGASRFRGDASVRTYVFKIARRTLQRHLCRERRWNAFASIVLASSHESALRTYPGDPSPRARHRVAAVLEASLRRLECQHRSLLQLIYYDGYTQREVAAILGSPLGSISGRVERATHALLRQLLQQTACATSDTTLSNDERVELELLAEVSTSTLRDRSAQGKKKKRHVNAMVVHQRTVGAVTD